MFSLDAALLAIDDACAEKVKRGSSRTPRRLGYFFEGDDSSPILTSRDAAERGKTTTTFKHFAHR